MLQKWGKKLQKKLANIDLVVHVTKVRQKATKKIGKIDLVAHVTKVRQKSTKKIGNTMIFIDPIHQISA